jgi:hypothetical protein
MQLILLWLVGGVTVALAVGFSLAALLPWVLRRRNLVHPRARGDAPIAWLISPGRLARLHRRLRRLVRHSRGLDAHGNDPARALIEALHLEAVRLDAELVAAAPLPRAARLERTVTLEGRAVKLQASARRVEALLDRPLVALRGGVDDLDEALTLLERSAGPTDHPAPRPRRRSLAAVERPHP